MTQHTPGAVSDCNIEGSALREALEALESVFAGYSYSALTRQTKLVNILRKYGNAARWREEDARLITEMVSLLRQILEDAWHEGPINNALRDIRALLAKIKGKDKP